MMYLLIAALLIIIALAAYAIQLTRKVKKQEDARRQQQAEVEAAARRQREANNRSIQLIAQGFLAEQMTATEAAIRIRGLLGLLEVPADTAEEFKAFYLLAEATSHIPILDQWKALKTKQKLIFDAERESLENDHREFVEDAARRILGRQF